MVDSQCHSFEDTLPTGNHHNSLTSLSRSESSQDSESVRLTEFATIHLPLLESPSGSQASLSFKPSTRSLNVAPRFKENKATHASSPSPERGRTRSRGPPVGDTVRNTHGSPTSPDRFIPKRDFADPPSISFRVNKHPRQLSPQERLLRRRLPGDDPFLPTARRLPAFPGQRPIPTRLRQSSHQRPRLVTDPAVVGGTRQNDFLRQVSSGAAWGVGGTSAILGDASRTTARGIPSPPSSGSAAPAYMARFLPRNTAADDQSKYESRLALALNIDPTTRLLATSTPCMENSPSPASPDYERLSSFVWKDSAWKKTEREHCKCCPCIIDFSLPCFCTTPL